MRVTEAYRGRERLAKEDLRGCRQFQVETQGSEGSSGKVQFLSRPLGAWPKTE
jgi:hypothetical protein